METWIQWITKAPPGALPKEDLPRQAHCMHAGQQRGYFHRVLSGCLCVHHTNLQQVIWHKAWTSSRQAAPPPWEPRPTAGEQSPHQGQPPLSIYRRQCPIAKGSSARIERQVDAADREGLQGAKRSNSLGYCEYLQRRRPPETADAHGAVICAEDPKGEAQTRKPDGQGLMACPPGLTADTTVFAIGRDTEMKVRMARRQGIASRGCLGSGICCTLALNALGGRFRFVWRCLKSTGASTLPKSSSGLKSDSQ